jgi:hypothetical protein
MRRRHAQQRYLPQQLIVLVCTVKQRSTDTQLKADTAQRPLKSKPREGYRTNEIVSATAERPDNLLEHSATATLLTMSMAALYDSPRMISGAL